MYPYTIFSQELLIVYFVLFETIVPLRSVLQPIPEKKGLLFNNNCSCSTCKTVNVACRNPMRKQIKLLPSAMPRQTCNIRVVGMKNVSDIFVVWCVWAYSFGCKKGINMIMVLFWWIHIWNFYSNSLWLHELVPGTQYSLIVKLNLFLAVVLKCRHFIFFSSASFKLRLLYFK